MFFFDINNTLITLFDYPLSYVEFIGTLFGLISVWLAAKDHIFTWGTGLVNVICFFAIFYQVHLYSDMFLQIYFFIISIYGWLTWKSQKQKDKPISILSTNQRVSILLLIVALTFVLSLVVKNIHLFLPKIFTYPASFPVIDSFIAIASIIATILLAKRIIESWIIWITVDIVSVVIFAKKNILFISFEYGIFLFLASYGFILWIKSVKNEHRISTW